MCAVERAEVACDRPRSACRRKRTPACPAEAVPGWMGFAGGINGKNVIRSDNGISMTTNSADRLTSAIRSATAILPSSSIMPGKNAMPDRRLAAGIPLKLQASTASPRQAKPNPARDLMGHRGPLYFLPNCSPVAPPQCSSSSFSTKWCKASWRCAFSLRIRPGTHHEHCHCAKHPAPLNYNCPAHLHAILPKTLH